jgi:plasmid stabilization system protein ParE
MVRWTFPARNDLRQIHAYIANDSRYYAQKVVHEIVGKARSLESFPVKGRVVPEIEDPNVREVFIYSYRLIYEIAADEIRVLAVIHGKRDLFLVE